MKKEGVFVISKFFLIVLSFVIFAGIVSASFEIGEADYSIDTEYDSGDYLSGWINISFSDESNLSLFEDSFDNEISLEDLIDLNPDFEYTLNSTGDGINADFQKLFLDDGNFLLSGSEGIQDYQLNFSEQEIFTEEINISETVLLSSLESKRSNLEDLKTKILTYDSFIQGILNSTLEINVIEDQLNKLEEEYENATTDEEKNEILANASNITLPDAILTTGESGLITNFPKKENVDLNSLTEATEEDYPESVSEYENAVLGWNVENLEIKTSFVQVSAIYSGEAENLVNVFEFKISQKNSIDEDFYFFVERLLNLEFKGNYGESATGNHHYIEIINDPQTITFSTTEDISFSDIPFFVAPPLNSLNLEEYGDIEPFEPEKEGFKWAIFGLVMLLLFIVGIVVYLVLQVWYKKKYEAYLFKNKNDLYNIANYITLSKKKGLDNKQIEKNLRKAKWSGEQIRYALRKYSGKRTGMFEIPLQKILQKKGRK